MGEVNTSLIDSVMFIVILIRILWLLSYITTYTWLFLINKKLWEKHSWLSFVPLLQIYSYIKASKKSADTYVIYPFIWVIFWWLLSAITFWISMLIATIYMIVMWIKLLHAISLRCWRWIWTTIWFIFIPFIMFLVVWIKLKDNSWEKKEKIETNNKKNEL